MRPSTILLAGALASLVTAFPAADAQAQVVPPAAERDENWGTVSTVAMMIGVSTVSLMPRVYYNDPEATVGWKARWHISVLAPIMTLTAATMLVDIPIKNLGEGTRPECTVEETESGFAGSNCESYGMPSTHSFAAWSATGAGVGIWVIDTFVHSDGEFHAGSFIGNVIVPLSASVFTSVARGVEPGNAAPYEGPAQIGVGVAAGVITGFLSGLAYALLQEPNCGYGNHLVCW
jgi:hypothetical protein